MALLGLWRTNRGLDKWGKVMTTSKQELRDKIDAIVWGGMNKELQVISLVALITQTVNEVLDKVEHEVMGGPVDFPHDPQTGAPVGTDGFIGLGRNYEKDDQRAAIQAIRKEWNE